MKIAAVQMDVQLASPAANVDRIVAYLSQTAQQGAHLTVFPECAVTGYCYASAEEAWPQAEPLPGPSSQRIVQACRELGVYCVYGTLEQAGARLYNAAVLVGPGGLLGVYRKVHLPYLGIDMHTEPGERLSDVFDAGGVRVGMNICYDAAFPEAARCLTLAGADLIALPTNWPPGAECVAECTIRSRAMENGVYFVAVNRVGEERGFRFIGGSSICAPDGTVLAAAEESEAVLYAEIDPPRARRKRVIRVPELHEIDRLADRRPALYGPLVQPHARPTPRDDHRVQPAATQD